MSNPSPRHPQPLPAGAVGLTTWPGRYRKETGKSWPWATVRQTRDEVNLGVIPCHRTEGGRIFCWESEWSTVIAAVEHSAVMRLKRPDPLAPAAIARLLARLAVEPLPEMEAAGD